MMFTIFGTKDSVRLAISTKKRYEKDSEIMAVNLAALHAVLVRKGTTTEVVNEVTATQGIDTIEGLHILTDDEVETLCRAIRQPGGLMPNPAFNATGGVAAALAAGIPAQVTNTGHMILARTENNIKLAAYFFDSRNTPLGLPMLPALLLEMCILCWITRNGKKPMMMSMPQLSTKKIGHAPSKQLRNGFEVVLETLRKSH